MKNILKFLFGSFLMLTAIPIAIALHYFTITKFPFLDGDYLVFLAMSCLVYVLFQLATGFRLVYTSSFFD